MWSPGAFTLPGDQILGSLGYMPLVPRNDFMRKEIFQTQPSGSGGMSNNLDKDYKEPKLLARIKTKNGHSKLYPSELKMWSPGCAKAPGIVDRKSVNISNINRFTLDDSRELSRVRATKF